jgi:uncharacterized protein with PIN domain
MPIRTRRASLYMDMIAKKQALEDSGGRCQQCGQPLGKSYHYIRRNRNIRSTYGNTIVICSKCYRKFRLLHQRIV